MKVFCVVIGILLWGSLNANSGDRFVMYDFKNGSPNGVAVKNVPSSIADGMLRIQIDESKNSWVAALVIPIEKALPENPTLRLHYKVVSPQTVTNAGLATTLKIDDVENKYGDKGSWRVYSKLNISKDEWQYHDIELQPLIDSWEATHGEEHGHVQEVSIVLGTSGSAFVARDLYIDNITIGSFVSIKRVDANPKNLKEIIVYFDSPVSGTPDPSNFELKFQGEELPLANIFLREKSRLVLLLEEELQIPEKPETMPAFSLEYSGKNEIIKSKDVALWPIKQDVSLSGILGDYIDINPDPRLGNPLHLTIFGPDPSAHVWSDGRLYVYPSRDTPDQHNYMGMQSWHVLSSEDLVEWTDHGRIFHVDDIDWVKEKAWAPDCAYKNGTYYFYFPVNDVNDEHWVGVATSKSPTGPFTNPVKFARWVDPNVFTDYEGNYWFALNSSIQKISDDMLSPVGEVYGYKDYAIGFPDYNGWAHEGTWVFKRNGYYYLTLAGKTAKPLQNGKAQGMPVMYYGMSKSPTGPFEFKGMLMDTIGNPYNPNYLANNHGSVVKYKGKWLVFYHKMWKAPDGNVQRAMCADYVTFNPDGTIQTVVPTDKGVDFRNYPSLQEMENLTFTETIDVLKTGGVEAKFHYASHDIIDPDSVVWDLGEGTRYLDRFEEGVTKTYTDKGKYSISMHVWLDGSVKKIEKKNLIQVK